MILWFSNSVIFNSNNHTFSVFVIENVKIKKQTTATKTDANLWILGPCPISIVKCFEEIYPS